MGRHKLTPTIVKVLALACLVFAIGGCASSQDAQSPEAPIEDGPQTIAEDTTTDYRSGTPWPCIDLEGVVTEDMEASARDNYDLFVNKDAILALEIPEGFTTAGTIATMERAVDQEIKDMFVNGDEPESHDAQLAYDLFQLMMDWDGRNAQGVAPLKAEVDEVEAINSLDELTTYLVEKPNHDKLGTIWTCTSTTDYDDADLQVLSVVPSVRIVGDSAEYVELSEDGKIQKDAIITFAQKMLVKMGYSEDEAVQKTENCWEFERLFSPSLMTALERAKPDYFAKTNNHFTYDELKELQKNIPLLETFEAMGYPKTDNYLVPQPAYIEKLNELYTDENLTLMKDYIIVHGVVHKANLLDRECYELDVECNNTMAGITGMPDDATAFSGTIAGRLKWAVAQLYAERYIKPEDKERIAKLVDEIIESYEGILEEADWISEETREHAIEKLRAIDKRVLYPDDWSSYSYDGLDFASVEEGGTLWDAERAMNAYEDQEAVDQFLDPVDKSIWSMSTQTPNCCYTPQTNSVLITGAFTRGGIYNSDMSDEEVYARLGTIIGHEVSHAFDSTGAQYDKDGNLANWWTEEDLAAFQERNARLAAYFNAMHPWEGMDIQGDIMTGETCADMAGMKCVLNIASQKENFDYDKFFRAYANLWLTKQTLPQVREGLMDAHPLLYLRINTTVQQYDEFYKTYGVVEGDGMYLAPEDRVAIW